LKKKLKIKSKCKKWRITRTRGTSVNKGLNDNEGGGGGMYGREENEQNKRIQNPA